MDFNYLHARSPTTAAIGAHLFWLASGIGISAKGVFYIADSVFTIALSMMHQSHARQRWRSCLYAACCVLLVASCVDGASFSDDRYVSSNQFPADRSVSVAPHSQEVETGATSIEYVHHVQMNAVYKIVLCIQPCRCTMRLEQCVHSYSVNVLRAQGESRQPV